MSVPSVCFQSVAGQAPPAALTCGTMPVGAGLHDFHTPPLRAHARNAEANYWREFSSRIVSAIPPVTDDEVIQASGNALGITASSAIAAYERQKKFFQALDHHDPHAEYVPASCISNRKSDPYDKLLEASIKKLP